MIHFINNEGRQLREAFIEPGDIVAMNNEVTNQYFYIGNDCSKLLFTEQIGFQQEHDYILEKIYLYARNPLKNIHLLSDLLN